MKTLDLNAYGVQELNAVEAMSIDGGNIWVRVLKTIYDAVKGYITVEVLELVHDALCDAVVASAEALAIAEDAYAGVPNMRR